MALLAPKSYVAYRNHAYWVEETRISLDSIVYAFPKGRSPESTVQAFPLLALEKVYEAIAFYLANCAEIDKLYTQRSETEDLQRTYRELDILSLNIA